MNQPKGLLTANLPTYLLGKVVTFGTAQRGPGDEQANSFACQSIMAGVCK